MAFVFIFAIFFFDTFFWVMRCTCDARVKDLHTTLFSVQSPTVLRLRRRHAHLVHQENVCVRQIAVIVEKFYVHKFKFFILFSYFIQRCCCRRCSCCCSCCCRCFSCRYCCCCFISFTLSLE